MTDETWTPDEMTEPPTKPKRTRRPKDRPPNDFPTGVPSQSIGTGDDGGDTAKTRKPTFAEDVAALYEMPAAMLLMIGMATGSAKVIEDASIVAEHGPKCAEAVVKYANHHPPFRRGLKKMIAGSDMTALVVAHGGLALAIAANHEFTIPGIVAAVKARMAPKPKPAPTPRTVPTGWPPPPVSAPAAVFAPQANVNGLGFPIAAGVPAES